MIRSISMAVTLALAMALAPSSALAKWRRASSRHFIIYSQDSAPALNKTTADLERYDQILRLVSLAKSDDNSAPLTIFMLPDAGRVGELINQPNAARFYTVGPLGPIAVAPRFTEDDYLENGMSPQAVLFHEYAHHHLLQNYAHAYPSWFVEGYAEVFGVTTFDDDGSANVGLAAKYRYAELGDILAIAIPSLLADDPNNRKGLNIYPFYSESWMLTHFLMFSDTRSPQLHRYLDLVGNGTKGADAARQAFGDVAKLVREFNAYRSANSIPALHLKQDKAPTIGEIRIDELDAAGQALVWDRLLYMRNLRAGEAPKIAADLVRRAATAPKDADTLDLLWRVELANNDAAAADRALDALLAVQQNNARALLGKGLVAMKRLEDAKNFEAPAWAAARQPLIDARQLQPDEIEILFAYHQSFVRARIAPPREAKLGLMRAFKQQPQSPSIRFALAASLMNDQRYAEARIVLKPAAFSVHDPDSAASAQKILGTIDGLKDGDPLPATAAVPGKAEYATGQGKS